MSTRNSALVARRARSGAAAILASLALIASLFVAAPAVAAEPVSAAAPAAAAALDAAASAPDVSAGIVKAAPVVGFDPENIISDALFYDGSAMTAAEIQGFLDSKIGRCANGKCLNVINASISDKAEWVSQTTGQLVCSAIKGGTMKVSELIYRMQTACGISAKVILVTLQKEQGLVTSTAPSDWNLQAAMGASCPDTAPCDPSFKGVGPQIFKGTQQLKTYKATRFARQPGVHFIGWSPNSACGGTSLNIRNYATAALYNYTPYQPNSAALNAGYGIGDGCSSYGNRNFYNYYTQWFGSTQVDTSAARGAIADAYAALGGASGRLGAASGGLSCGLSTGGCLQQYAGGQITWSPATSAFATYGGIGGSWLRAGAQDGFLGYPTSRENCGLVRSGCYQDFENGKIYWTASTDARPVQNALVAGWSAYGYERGRLGYPLADATCGLTGGGCIQRFEGGDMIWSPRSGAFPVWGSIADGWRQLGADTSKIGYPIGGEGCGLPASGCYQDFERGKIYWSPSTGAAPVGGGILRAFAASGYERGALGYPISQETCGLTDGGCSQAFVGGTMFWSAPTDAQVVLPGMLKGYLALGGPASKLGYPAAREGCGLPANGCYQEFRGGQLHWNPVTGAQPTWGAIGGLWAQTGRERGPLGYPQAAEECDASGCAQRFESGTVYWSGPTGAVSVRGDLDVRYRAAGGRLGRLGYPVSEQQCGSGVCTQAFQKGTLP